MVIEYTAGDREFWQRHLEHCRAEAVPVIYEQLLQQKRAADMLELSKDQVEQLFWRNACNFIRDLKSS